MPGGQVLEFNRVTKRFGDATAVADLSVRVEPGVVTAFVGPNGAGKTTSLRMLLGQIRPTSGTATIGGSSYSELRQPLRTIGAVLEEAAYRPRRSAARQLQISAKANGIPVARVEEVLRLVGLQDDADTRLGSYSLGMRQRLAVASALLGDPGVLVLDEPANGLDPEGIRWMRLLMRRLADEGRTVLVSSHVLSEIEQVADNVVVLSKGRAAYSGPIEELADPTGGAVIVDAENRAQLITALSSAKLNFDVLRSGVTVRDSDAATVGAITAAAGVPLTLLQQRGPSLEDVFLDLVYGRRSDSPRLDQVANPVAHAPQPAEADSAAGLAAAGAAAVVADGGMVAAAGVGYGTAPIEIIPGAADADAAEADEASSEGGDAATPEDPANADTADATAADAAEDAGAAPADLADADAADAAEADAAEADAMDVADAAAEDDAAAPEDVANADAADSDADHGIGSDSVAEADIAVQDESAAPDAEREASGTEQAANEADGDSEPSDEASDEAAAGADATDADATDAAPEDAERTTDAESSLRDSVAGLWAPRLAAGADDAASTPAASDSDAHDASAPEGGDGSAQDENHSEADPADFFTGDDERPDVLPQATGAVSISPLTDTTTFTELITGIPASAAPADALPSTPATEAIPVFAPIVSHDDDDASVVDDPVDDADEDPRLAAMRTSLSSAASRFFDGPAPDYPYGDVPKQDAATSDGEQPADAPDGEQTETQQHDEGDQHHG